ncbi:unnamed protein product, partial [marine sediment metagenome]
IQSTVQYYTLLLPVRFIFYWMKEPVYSPEDDTD